jgi:hypothetical protein
LEGNEPDPVYDFNPEDESNIDEVLRILLEGNEPAPPEQVFFETQPSQPDTQQITESTVVNLGKRKSESIPETIKEYIEEIIKGFKVSDIYTRGEGNKSWLNPTGKNILKQIYDYIRDYEINDRDLDLALNLTGIKSIDFLTRLFNTNPQRDTKEEKINLILEHIYHARKDNTKKKYIYPMTRDNTKQIYNQVLSKLEPYLIQSRKIFENSGSSKREGTVWKYRISYYGKNLKNEIESVFSTLKLSREDIVDVLRQFENKYVLKIFKALSGDFYTYSINSKIKEILVEKIADMLQKL